MKWTDCGGFSRNLHIVTRSYAEGHFHVLCGTSFTYGFHVERRLPLPACRNCLAILGKLQFKAAQMRREAKSLEIHRWGRTR